MGSLQHGEKVRNNILEFITGYIQQHIEKLARV